MLTIALAGLMLAAPINAYSESEAANATRVCIAASGHSTQLSVSSSAGSGDLGSNQPFSFVCTVAVYWETGDSAAATADSNSNYLPIDTLVYLSTGGVAQSRFISAVDTATSGGTCYITLCE